MKLSAPTFVVFLISVILAGAVIAVTYGGVSIPVVSAHRFETLLAAYVVLLVGTLFKGL